jgi:hypothetical protein
MIPAITWTFGLLPPKDLFPCDLGYHVRPFVLLPPKDLFPCDLGYHVRPFVLLPPKDLFPCDLGYPRSHGNKSLGGSKSKGLT